MKREDLARLARFASESAWSSLVSAAAFIAACALAMLEMGNWSLIPLGIFLLAEASVVFCVVGATRGISDAGAKLDGAARFGWFLAITRIPAALAIVLPLASAQLNSGASSGYEVAVILGPLLMLAAVVSHAAFLRNTARGVSAGGRRARVDNLASAAVLAVAITAALVLCLIGLLLLPIALLLAATLNLSIARVIARVAAECRVAKA